MRARSVKLPSKGALLEILHYDDDVLVDSQKYVILDVIKTRRASFVEDAKLIDVVVLNSKGVIKEFSIHEAELGGARWYGSRKVLIRSE